MNKIIKKVAVLGGAVALMISTTACSALFNSLDVVGKEAKASFQAVLSVIPEQVETDETNMGWSLSSPDGSVKFIWSKDWSRSPLYDVMLEFDAQPFLDAGLDVQKLPENMVLSDNMLVVGTKLGDDVLEYDGTPTPLASFEQIVSLDREAIGYHTEMDHYGVDLGNGNMFEWAKDMSTNDKDIVFVLDPEPYINAGVDPGAVEGWVFTTVTVNMEEVEKILKPFDLE